MDRSFDKPNPTSGIVEKNPATYFSIDIECSGQVPAIYDMVSLGARTVFVGKEGGLELGGTFYVELRPESHHVDPEAMAIHGLTLEHLQAHGRSRRQALTDLAAFVRAETRPGTEAVFVGHNAPFDWSFVAYSFAAECMDNPFGYKALDTKALAAGVLGLHWLKTDKGRLHKLLDLPSEDRSLKHRADYDAEYQARILMALLERMPAAAR